MFNGWTTKLYSLFLVCTNTDKVSMARLRCARTTTTTSNYCISIATSEHSVGASAPCWRPHRRSRNLPSRPLWTSSGDLIRINWSGDLDQIFRRSPELAYNGPTQWDWSTSGTMLLNALTQLFVWDYTHFQQESIPRIDSAHYSLPAFSLMINFRWPGVLR